MKQMLNIVCGFLQICAALDGGLSNLDWFFKNFLLFKPYAETPLLPCEVILLEVSDLFQSVFF